MLCEEFVDDFGEQLVCYQCGVGVVADYDPADTLGASVGVECVVLFFHILPLTGSGSLCHCLAEEGHELAIVVTCESRVGAQIFLGAELMGGFRLVFNYPDIMQLHICDC